MVITAAVEVCDHKGRSFLHEDIVVPPVFVYNTKGNTLLAALMREVERLLGQSFLEWTRNNHGRVSWILLSIRADRASSNRRAVRLLKAIAYKIWMVTGVWLLINFDPCVAHFLSNITVHALERKQELVFCRLLLLCRVSPPRQSFKSYRWTPSASPMDWFARRPTPRGRSSYSVGSSRLWVPDS